MMSIFILLCALLGSVPAWAWGLVLVVGFVVVLLQDAKP